MRLAKTLRVLAVAAPILWCGTAFAGTVGVPEIDPGTAGGGISLLTVCTILILERYRRR
jgi:hypothetical protein